MQNFRNLIVWQKSHALALSVYRVTQSMPKQELYGLTSQLRRAAGSIPANIAEGCGRGSDADLKRFLQIAMGSASELDYHLLLARDLGYIETTAHRVVAAEVAEVMRMLASFVVRLRPVAIDQTDS